MAVRELSSSPSMAVLYPRAALSAGRAALGRLPGVGGDARELPDEELVLTGVQVDRDRLAAYDRVCTFEIGDLLPPTYPHVLAFPLSMKLMTSVSFPFPVVGLVHVRNRIERRRAIATDEPLTLRMRADRLAPHDRGTQFELLAEAESGGEVVWRSESTYLHREGGSGGDGSRKDRPDPPEPSAEWSVPGDVGRRYAGVSGDRNPIHLHTWSARAFGQPRAIAHGMWMKARCLAVVDGLLPDACSIDVSFKLPRTLPGRVAFATRLDGGTRHLELRDAKSGKPHLVGTVAPL